MIPEWRASARYGPAHQSESDPEFPDRSRSDSLQEGEDRRQIQRLPSSTST
jgi:hypothetical protein